jgi:hypothetical protein
MTKEDDNDATANRRRAAVIARLRLKERYKRSHSQSGVFRRLEEPVGPPEAKPKANPGPPDGRLKNLLKRHRGKP